MDRRAFLELASLAGLAATPSQILSAVAQESASPESVQTVLLVTKCHFDVGFSKTQAQVIREYFDVHYPAAIRIASELRAAGKVNYTWTTGSWLLYEYLEQADSAQRKAMEHAIANRDIAWHALPFSWQTEMIDQSMISGALSFSHVLDRRFGTETTGSKMTDVPGHSRGIIGPLVRGGVRLLDVGVNAASSAPDVPDLFLWKNQLGESLAVLYHRRDYGSTIIVPRASIAVAVEVRGDNSGPHTPLEIARIYRDLQTRFPNAQVKAATLTDVAVALESVRNALPVVTSEIGDTWIYGCASDPVKVSRYRSVSKQREAWIAQKRFSTGDETDRKFLGHLLLAPEHTWGTDTKAYLHDDHYTPADLATVLRESGYVTMESSWKEKRNDIDAALASLPAQLQAEANAGLAALTPTFPNTAGMKPHDSVQPFDFMHYEIALEKTTGAIAALRNKSTGVSWASVKHPLALFTYQTYSAEQYASYLKRYLTVATDWAPKDFGKPGIEKFGAVAQEWHPTIRHCLKSVEADGERLVVEMAIDDPPALEGGAVAWPRCLVLEMKFPFAEARIDLRLLTAGKKMNRMPEAMWLTFQPAHVSADSWEMDKVNQLVVASDVVSGGGRNMHAVSESIRCHNMTNHQFLLTTLDAPVVSFGVRSALNFSKHLPDFALGAHVNLFNNAWGTNYPQWSGGDWLYRFRLHA